MGFRFRRTLKAAGLHGVVLDGRRTDTRAADVRGCGLGCSEQRRHGASATLLLIAVLALLVFALL